MSVRLIAFAIVAALGGAAVWQISLSSMQAAIVVGIAVAVLALGVLVSGGSAPRKRVAGGKDALPGHAVAFRQSRAMARAEDGEIRGIPGGPA